MDSTDFGDDLFVQKATPENFDELLNFVKLDFCKNEPLTNSLDTTSEEMGPLLKDMVAASLKEPCFTYIVRLKNTNEIIAARMMGILERPSSNHFENYESWKPNIIMKLVKELEQKVWDIRPNAQKLACGLLISVHQNYTRLGIAQKLVEYNLDEIKEAGCEGLVREATAKNSQKLFAKLGYQNLYEILHSDFKENGKQIFHCRDGTDRAILVYKSLI